MLFNSVEFPLFFVAVLVLYWRLPHRGQNVFLLGASYFFYGCWDYRFLSLILLSTVVDYVCGLRMGATDNPRARRRWLVASVAVNLGILGAFKYCDFFVASAVELAGGLGLAIDHHPLNIILPVGISFYTFQTLSYTIDVFRGKIQPTRQPLQFALFVAFFPQLVAGPIERAARLLPQIARKRHFSCENLYSGTYLAAWGLFKKVFIADNLSPLVDAVYGQPETAGSVQVLIATYAFALQIYCDFSGYSDIARGCARCLGFDLMINFRLPYFAVSPSDFWRRWHISLSSWLREYLYIPLGGNRRGVRILYRNLMITMLLGGLWHGAAWHFVAWGAFHGLLLVGQRLLGIGTTANDGPQLAWRDHLARIPAVFIMFHLTCFAWLLFRATALSDVPVLLAWRPTEWATGAGDAALVALYASPLLLIQVLQYVRRRLDVVEQWPTWTRAVWYAAGFYALLLGGELGAREFIYFQF